jgi:two-component SAPR family response regulator
MRIELLQKAVNLVHGQLLEDIYTIWVEPERERLKQEVLAALLELADLLKNNNQVYEALNVYQQAIEYEPTFETAYLLAMKLYIQLNDRGNTLRLYDAYKEMMRQELNLPPSAEIEAVFKRLMH